MPRDFRLLWTADAVSQLGNGLTLTAGPLLLARLTADPALVAGSMFVQQLPWLLFGLVSGAYVDRVDRRRLTVAVDLIRAVAVGALALVTATGNASVGAVYAIVFVLGIGDTLASNAANALTPAVVPDDLLPRANARLTGTHTLLGMLAGPPVGAALFVLAVGAPFGVDAVTFLVAALLVSRLRWRPEPVDAGKPRTSLRKDIAEGIGWLWRHKALRTLALSICLMNLTFGGIMGVFVLYAHQRLGLGDLGYGVLISVSAVGGLVGSGLAARLEERFGTALLLRIGLVIEAVTDTALGLTSSPWVAGAIYAVFGVHAVVWGVLTMSLRQRAVPPQLRGRVNSVYYLFSVGGMALGALQGGLVARWLGITAPFLTAGALVALLAVLSWRLFTPAVLDRVTAPAPAEQVAA